MTKVLKLQDRYSTEFQNMTNSERSQLLLGWQSVLIACVLMFWFETANGYTKPAGQQRKSQSSITGTYEQGNNDLGSELIVKELPGKRIKFSLYSYWRCPDGSACNGSANGVVPLKNSMAEYRQTDPAFAYVLRLRFSHSACLVECNAPSNFGGFNVDPSGNYRKVSSKAKIN